MGSKVLFVQSWLGENELPVFPIALSTVAAYLPATHERSGIDPNICAAPLQDLTRRIKDFRPDVVAVSLRNIDTTDLYHPHIYYNSFISTINTIREADKSVAIAAGGSGFSLFAEQIMRENPAIDFGIYLEGELTFAAATANLGSPDKVPGLYYRAGKDLKFSGERELHSIENAPYPAWELFDPNLYRKFPFPVGVESKRGCAFKCAYCSYFLLHGKTIRLKKPERVIGEMAELRRRFDIKEICFLDSVFNVPSDHAIKILKLMKAELPGQRWLGYVSERGLTQEFIDAAKDTDTHVLAFSTDAYTDRCLDAMGKGISVKQIEDAVEVVKRNPPLHVGFNFFVNGPGYTYGTLWRMLMFFIRTKLKLGPRFRLLKMNLGYIRIEPQTPIYDIALAEGVITKDTNLLPTTLDGFRKCFYINKRLGLFNTIWIALNTWARKILMRHRDRIRL